MCTQCTHLHMHLVNSGYKGASNECRGEGVRNECQGPRGLVMSVIGRGC